MVTIVKAKIKLYNSKNGRRTPFTTGYRPIFDIEQQEVKTSGQIDLIGKSTFSPGEDGYVKIRFLSKFLTETFRVGTNFIFSEGSEPIGEGVVVEILDSVT